MSTTAIDPVKEWEAKHGLASAAQPEQGSTPDVSAIALETPPVQQPVTRLKEYEVYGGPCPRRYIRAASEAAAEVEYRNIYGLRRPDMAIHIKEVT